MKKLFFILLFSNILFANTISFKNDYTLDTILKNKKWNQLLYYENEISQVTNKEFFLSKNGQKNPKEELITTINSYTSKETSNDSAVCKFPARYLFLKDYIEFEDYEYVNPKCTNLKAWLELVDTDSISVVLVSGYVSNPASTFGHSFFKLNSSKNEDLFNTSVNYGALVPENESIFKYVIRGLTGLYEAGFSDKYFYTQDLNYSNIEFRDMWEYELSLNEEQLNLLQFHFWEIIQKKFDYYFLSKNCGYRVSEVLNLITANNFKESNNSWFIPIETFNDLEKEQELIKSIKFIPSNKRVFKAHYELLSESAKKVTLKVIKEGEGSLSALETLSQIDKIESLSFLLVYYSNSLSIDPSNFQLKKMKKIILTERFKYERMNQKKIKIKAINSPSKSTNPIYVGAGISNSSYRDFYGTVSFSPFSQPLLGITNLGSDELITLDTKMGFEKDSVFLESFDFINIKKISIDPSEVLDESSYSWKLHLGTKEVEKNKYYTFANFGIGEAFKHKDLVSYTFVDFILNNRNEYVKLSPNLNFDYKYRNLKTHNEIGYNINPLGNRTHDAYYLKSEVQYNISKDQSIYYSYEDSFNTRKHSINFRISF